MKKKFLLFSILISSFSLLQSCSSDLDIKSESVITSANFWKTEDDAKAGVNGMYYQFRTVTQQTYYLLGGARSAEITGGVQSPLTLANYYNNDLTAQNIDVDWASLYTVIHSANLVIKYVPTITFSPATQNEQKRYLAQAYSMRALAYFIMARSWGGVPIVTKPTENSNQSEYTLPRNTLKETFDFIKSDIELAISNFPDETNNKTQLSLPAVNALKADVFLWTAKQLDGGETDLRTALAAVEKIPSLSLLPNFADVFSYTNKGNAEVLFAIRYSVADVTSNLNDNWNSFMYVGPADITGFTETEYKAAFGTIGSGAGNAGISRVQPNINRFNFSATDKRKDATYKTLYNSDDVPVVTGLLKYNGTVDGTLRRFVSDIIIYRAADILLMKAEIKNALNIDPTTEMNLVMKRADASASFTSSSPESNDLVILNERLKELAFEGKAWWDLVRFNKTDLVPSMTAGKKILFPISQATINYNPNITQNP